MNATAPGASVPTIKIVQVPALVSPVMTGWPPAAFRAASFGALSVATALAVCVTETASIQRASLVMYFHETALRTLCVLEIAVHTSTMTTPPSTFHPKPCAALAGVGRPPPRCPSQRRQRCQQHRRHHHQRRPRVRRLRMNTQSKLSTNLRPKHLSTVRPSTSLVISRSLVAPTGSESAALR